MVGEQHVRLWDDVIQRRVPVAANGVGAGVRCLAGVPYALLVNLAPHCSQVYVHVFRLGLIGFPDAARLAA